MLVSWLAGLCSVLLWWNVSRQFDWRVALAGLCVLTAGSAARTSWKNMPDGQLAWDGDAWRWESAGYQTGMAEHTLSVIADFQNHLLLRLENQARASLWLWVGKSAMPERWLDLRRAVYSPHKSAVASAQHDFLPAEPVSPPAAAAAISGVMHTHAAPWTTP